MMDKVMNHTQKCVLKDTDFQSISGCAGWSMICLKYWTVIYIYIYICICIYTMIEGAGERYTTIHGEISEQSCTIG